MFKVLCFWTLFTYCAANNFLTGITIPQHLKECIPTAAMLDASGKIPAGIFGGNIFEIGAFDLCLTIGSKNNPKTTKGDERGKYCVMRIALGSKSAPLKRYNPPEANVDQRIALMQADPTDNRTSMFVGWCIPEKCDPKYVGEVVTSVLKYVDLEVFPILEGMCQTEDDLQKEITSSDWGVISFFIIIAVLMAGSTLYDIYLHFAKKRPAHTILIAFSVKYNGEKLLAVSKNPDQLSCLNGIRFISMMWVVLGHRYAMFTGLPVTNLLEGLKWQTKPGNMFMINAGLSVDSFFVLSGLLLGYVYCLSQLKGVKFNVLFFYLHRYLRLTPVLGVVILIYSTILPHFGSGPFWPLGVKNLQDGCFKNWWAPLIYIQNYYENAEVCIGQTWYLAVDMQLFILSPLLLIPYIKWPTVTTIISYALVVVSIAITIIIGYAYELPASSFILDSEKSLMYMSKYYYPTHTRFGPWLMGLMLGWYIFQVKQNKVKVPQMNPLVVTLCWGVALAIMLGSLFGGHNLLSEPNRIASAIYIGLDRHGWSLGLCWVIYACIVGYGGIINSFLSWAPFQVLGRFTYTIYLVHLGMQYLMAAGSRSSYYFVDFYPMYFFWGDLFLALAIAAVLTLAFESPMIIIEKVIFGMDKRKPDATKTNGQAKTEASTNKKIQDKDSIEIILPTENNNNENENNEETRLKKQEECILSALDDVITDVDNKISKDFILEERNGDSKINEGFEHD